MFRLLPWEYGVRNLLRRPVRSLLTLASLATVVLVVFAVLGFARGLEETLSAGGDPCVVLVHSLGGEESIESSAIAAQTPELLAASLENVRVRFGTAYISPELYLGLRMAPAGRPEVGLGLVRGVTHTAPLVRERVRITEGAWPGPGEVLAGRLAAAKLGLSPAELAPGRELTFEKRSWRVSGRFSAAGAAFESEIWCRLEDLQQALKRQDLSLVALRLRDEAGAAHVELFCKERTDLELAATSEAAWYAALQRHYRPLRTLAWLVVLLLGGAGAFMGCNTMYAAVAGRTRELATLQALGFRRRAILLSIVQEGTLLAAAAALAAAALALVAFRGVAVRFTMGALVLSIDSTVLLAGCGVGLLVGVLGSLPPALKAMRLSVAQGLKAI